MNECPDRALHEHRVKTLEDRSAIVLDASGIDAGAFEHKAIDLVNAAFTVLAILGIVVDPTTKGFSDGSRGEDDGKEG